MEDKARHPVDVNRPGRRFPAVSLIRRRQKEVQKNLPVTRIWTGWALALINQATVQPAVLEKNLISRFAGFVGFEIDEEILLDTRADEIDKPLLVC